MAVATAMPVTDMAAALALPMAVATPFAVAMPGGAVGQPTAVAMAVAQPLLAAAALSKDELRIRRVKGQVVTRAGRGA
jgi:hypothetical protein